MVRRIKDDLIDMLVFRNKYEIAILDILILPVCFLKVKPKVNVDWNDMDGLDTDNSWKFFISKVNYCIEKHVPVKRANVRFKKPKWMDQYCVRKVKKKYHAWKRFTFSYSYVDYENYCKLRNSASKAVRFAKKRYQRGIAESVKI